MTSRGFLLESVEHAERWGRWSFIGRRPRPPWSLRGGQLSGRGRLPAGVPARPGRPGRHRGPAGRLPRPPLDGLPPLHGGLVGYLGYDVVREVERLPDAPPDEHGYPDAIVSVVGQVAAYDSLAPAGHADRVGARPRRAATGRAATPSTTRPWPRLEDLAAGGRRSLSTSRWSTPPSATTSCREFRRRTSPELYARGGGGGQGAHPRRRHLPGGAGPALRPRARGRAVRPVPLAAPGQPEPLHVLPPSPRAVAWSGPPPSRMVQLLDGRVISRPIAGTRRRGAHRRGRPAPGRRADRAPQGDGPST